MKYSLFFISILSLIFLSSFVLAEGSNTSTNSTKSIKILSPNSGESFIAGDQIEVKWDSSGISSDSQITIRLNPTSEGGYYWSFGGLKNTGYYKGIVPTLLTGPYYIDIEVSDRLDIKDRADTPIKIDSTNPKLFEPEKASETSSLELEFGDVSGADNAGMWGVFGPGKGFGNPTTQDWSWAAKLKLSEEKTIKYMTMTHSNIAEAWSTSGQNAYNKPSYPLVVFKDGVQIVTAYDVPFGPYKAGEYTFKLYGQMETGFFAGSKLIIVFTDGTYVSATVKGRDNNYFIVTETLTCIFNDNKEEQKCYAENKRDLECKGREKCSIEVRGNNGEKLVWKSSCSLGSFYTIIDGSPDYLTFFCGEKDKLEVKTYFSAKWKCNNGEEAKSAVRDEDSCQTEEVWRQKAEEFCKKACINNVTVGITDLVIANQEKCSVAAFNLGSACEKKVVINPKDEPIDLEDELKNKEEVNCNGCRLEDKCYPFGYRKSGNYCSDNGAFVNQTLSNGMCENNFECSSNVCVSGRCVSPGLLNKILDWFKRLFGAEA